MKSIIFFCRLHDLPEMLLASLKTKCPDAGTIKCYSTCEWRGLRVVGKIV